MTWRLHRKGTGQGAELGDCNTRHTRTEDPVAGRRAAFFRAYATSLPRARALKGKEAPERGVKEAHTIPLMSLLLLFNANLRPFHADLMDSARRLADEGSHEIAVVTAQMAAEIVSEQVLTALLGTSKMGDSVEAAVDGLLRTYALTGQGTRRLYVALSGDQIGQAGFWPAYDEHVKRRHGAVHGGKRVDAKGAQASIRAVEALIEHLLTAQSQHATK